MANGHSRKAIARHLAIADSTFRATVAHIYRKLGVSSELGAALAMGYVTPPSLVEMAGNYALTETWTASA